MDPLGTAATYTQSGSLRNTAAGPIDWVEFVFFNTSTDPAEDTDFYVKSLEILGDAAWPGVTTTTGSSTRRTTRFGGRIWGNLFN
jgi:hypothetical protein